MAKPSSTTADTRPCSIAQALELVGDRYAILVLRELFFGNHRFAEIAKQTGAPRDVLTARLRKLEAFNLIERRQYSERPPRSEYVLTEAGDSFYPVLQALRQWGDDRCWDSPDDIPLVVDHECGARFRAAVVCASCGEPVRSDSLHLADTA